MLIIPYKLGSVVCLRCYIRKAHIYGLIKYSMLESIMLRPFQVHLNVCFTHELSNWILNIMFQNMVTSQNMTGILLYMMVIYKLKYIWYSRLIFPLHCCTDYSNGHIYIIYMSQKDINYLSPAEICYHSSHLMSDIYIYIYIYIHTYIHTYIYICSLYNNGNFLISFNYSSIEYFYDSLKHPSFSSINYRISVFAKSEYHLLVGIRIIKI